MTNITSNSSSIPSPSIPSPYIDRFNSSTLDTSFSFKGVQNFFLDLMKEGNQKSYWSPSSSNKQLTWSRSWTPTSPQIALLNQHQSCIAQNLYKEANECLFDTLQEAKLECSETISGHRPLRALSESGVPLKDCTLQLTNSDASGAKVLSTNLENIFVKSNKAFPSTIRTQLYSIINFLRRGKLSFQEAALDLKNRDFQKLTSLLTFDAMQSNELGGSFWGTLRAAISTTNPKIFGLTNPGKTIPFIPGSYQASAQCSLGEEASSGKYETTCVHTLFDDSGEQPTERIRLAHTEGGTTRILGSPTQVDNWNKALREKKLVALSSSTGIQENNREELTVSHSYFDGLPSSNFIKAPTKDDLLHSLLTPIGLGITAAGLFYAKSNYENTKKTGLRRVVGGVVGIAGAILGVGVAALPFGLFSNNR